MSIPNKKEPHRKVKWFQIFIVGQKPTDMLYRVEIRIIFEGADTEMYFSSANSSGNSHWISTLWEAHVTELKFKGHQLLTKIWFCLVPGHTARLHLPASLVVSHSHMTILASGYRKVCSKPLSWLVIKLLYTYSCSLSSSVSQMGGKKKKTQQSPRIVFLKHPFPLILSPRSHLEPHFFP